MTIRLATVLAGIFVLTTSMVPLPAQTGEQNSRQVGNSGDDRAPDNFALLNGDSFFAVADKAPKVHGDPARLKRIRAAKMPAFAGPVMFDTPEADAIVSALEVFPENNPWNLVVADWPLHPNSKFIIASIGANKVFRCNEDMGYILVPPDQKKVDVKIVAYPDESDKGPFPVADNTPIEGWPVQYTRVNK